MVHHKESWITARMCTTSLLIIALLSLTNIAFALSVGPDAFGYRASDGGVFAFEDISATGYAAPGNKTSAAILDAHSGWLPDDFDFTYYGVTYSQVVIGAAGYISFVSTLYNSDVNLETTSPGPNVPVINVLADQWGFIAGTGRLYHEVRGTPGDYRFIVQWDNGYNENFNDTATFEAILFQKSGDILFQYLDVDSGDDHSFGALASVGIRDTDGNLNGRALQWSFNSPSIKDGQAIRFSTTTPVPTPATFSLMSLGLVCIGFALKKKQV